MLQIAGSGAVRAGRVFIASIVVFTALDTVGRAHDLPAEMAAAARRFIQSLDAEQQAAACIEFDSPRRQAWHFVPSTMMPTDGGRRGLAVKQMSPAQRHLAHGLLSTALSHHGYLQATSIMALEEILHDLEGGNPARDPELYHVAVFGTPSTSASWGWSFEGHHLSVNLTLVDGRQFSVTPSFFGTNPAKVPTGPQAGWEVLGAEQHQARKLVQSLTPEQRKLAIIATTAPSDIITGADRSVGKDRFEPPQGISFDRLSGSQQEMLLELVRQFAAKHRRPIIEQVHQRTPIDSGAGMHFAWAGGLEPGEGHYYRIQTPHFLFEYDNTQNDANHIHAVWREFDGDFGEDLLRRHYETSPHHRQQ
jgi:hypothetical protein